MSIVHDLRQTSRLGLLVGGAAATIGVIYGYDLSNIAGALLFITDQIHLSTPQQELGVLDRDPAQGAVDLARRLTLNPTTTAKELS